MNGFGDESNDHIESGSTVIDLSMLIVRHMTKMMETEREKEQERIGIELDKYKLEFQAQEVRRDREFKKWRLDNQLHQNSISSLQQASRDLKSALTALQQEGRNASGEGDTHAKNFCQCALMFGSSGSTRGQFYETPTMLSEKPTTRSRASNGIQNLEVKPGSSKNETN